MIPSSCNLGLIDMNVVFVRFEDPPVETSGIVWSHGKAMRSQYMSVAIIPSKDGNPFRYPFSNSFISHLLLEQISQLNISFRYLIKHSLPCKYHSVIPSCYKGLLEAIYVSLLMTYQWQVDLVRPALSQVLKVVFKVFSA